jgi:methionyl aminopeptidase
MRDLSGHLIRPYTIHAGKAVPNIAIEYPSRMIEGEFYAIEPFLTTGDGVSIYTEPNSHCMLKTKTNNKRNKYYEYLFKQYNTLPFCIRWLDREKWNYEYTRLKRDNLLLEYPPIYDVKGSYVSQFEHTIYVREKGGNICLTNNNNY